VKKFFQSDGHNFFSFKKNWQKQDSNPGWLGSHRTEMNDDLDRTTTLHPNIK
jgi:hypothetical protein